MPTVVANVLYSFEGALSGTRSAGRGGGACYQGALVLTGGGNVGQGEGGAPPHAVEEHWPALHVVGGRNFQLPVLHAAPLQLVPVDLLRPEFLR